MHTITKCLRCSVSSVIPLPFDNIQDYPMQLSQTEGAVEGGVFTKTMESLHVC